MILVFGNSTQTMRGTLDELKHRKVHVEFRKVSTWFDERVLIRYASLCVVDLVDPECLTPDGRHLIQWLSSDDISTVPVTMYGHPDNVKISNLAEENDRFFFHPLFDHLDFGELAGLERAARVVARGMHTLWQHMMKLSEEERHTELEHLLMLAHPHMAGEKEVAAKLSADLLGHQPRVYVGANEHVYRRTSLI